MQSITWLFLQRKSFISQVISQFHFNTDYKDKFQV
jgi:hypothetical protein